MAMGGLFSAKPLGILCSGFIAVTLSGMDALCPCPRRHQQSYNTGNSICFCVCSYRMGVTLDQGEPHDAIRPKWSVPNFIDITSSKPYGEAVLMMDFLKDLYAFMRERKKYWLIPIIIVLLLLGALIVLSQGSVVAPFIYTLF